MTIILADIEQLFIKSQNECNEIFIKYNGGNEMKKVAVYLIMFMLAILVACGGAETEKTDQSDELAVLEVEFIVPETADPGETVTLEAVVTYGEEKVEDAKEVVFEYWLKGNEDNSTKIDGVHQENGSYIADVTFEEAGIYEMYAHTTAKGLHTMPLTSITIGDGGEVEDEEEQVESEHHDHGNHAEGFHLHFMKPEEVMVSEETDLVVHLQMDKSALAAATVRYEIAPEGKPENTAWVDAEETAEGEYASSHTFTEAGTYTIVIHVEDDSGLHEHEEFSVEAVN